MCFEREVPGLEELNGHVRVISPECLGARRNEIGIKLAPHSQQGRLRQSKVLLKLRIQLHVVGIIQEKIKLYIDVPGTRQQGSVQGVALRFDASRIWNSDRVFVAQSFEVQTSADGIPMLQGGFTPIALNGSPSAAEALFIRVAICDTIAVTRSGRCIATRKPVGAP